MPTVSTPVSPKVGWPVFAGFIFTALLGSFNLITPDMVRFLGPWTPWVLGTCFILLQYLVGYYKTDPLRVPVPQDTATPTSTAPAADLATQFDQAARPAIQFPAAKVAATEAPPA